VGAYRKAPNVSVLLCVLYYYIASFLFSTLPSRTKVEWERTYVKTVRKVNTEERNLGTARLSLTTNKKVELASRASNIEVTLLRQGEQRNTRQGDRAEQKRRDREAAKPTIRYCLVMLDLPSDKRPRRLRN
jgi:hypothetical protein